MKKSLVFACLFLTLIFQACSKSSTEPDGRGGSDGNGNVDSKTGSEFSGITYTDETGLVTGTEDKDDWNMVLVSGDSSKDTSIVVVRDSLHYIPAIEFSFLPAYPNPAANGYITLRFNLKVLSSVKLYVCDKPGNVIDTLINSRQLQAGSYSYAYHRTDFTDKQILRTFLEITSKNGNRYSSYGDIQLGK